MEQTERCASIQRAFKCRTQEELLAAIKEHAGELFDAIMDYEMLYAAEPCVAPADVTGHLLRLAGIRGSAEVTGEDYKEMVENY
jgi:hypothetical protein